MFPLEGAAEFFLTVFMNLPISVFLLITFGLFISALSSLIRFLLKL